MDVLTLWRDRLYCPQHLPKSAVAEYTTREGECDLCLAETARRKRDAKRHGTGPVTLITYRHDWRNALREVATVATFRLPRQGSPRIATGLRDRSGKPSWRARNRGDDVETVTARQGRSAGIVTMVEAFPYTQGGLTRQAELTYIVRPHDAVQAARDAKRALHLAVAVDATVTALALAAKTAVSLGIHCPMPGSRGSKRRDKAFEKRRFDFPRAWAPLGQYLAKWAAKAA